MLSAGLLLLLLSLLGALLGGLLASGGLRLLGGLATPATAARLARLGGAVGASVSLVPARKLVGASGPPDAGRVRIYMRRMRFTGGMAPGAPIRGPTSSCEVSTI